MRTFGWPPGSRGTDRPPPGVGEMRGQPGPVGVGQVQRHDLHPRASASAAWRTIVAAWRHFSPRTGRSPCDGPSRPERWRRSVGCSRVAARKVCSSTPTPVPDPPGRVVDQRPAVEHDRRPGGVPAHPVLGGHRRHRRHSWPTWRLTSIPARRSAPARGDAREPLGPGLADTPVVRHRHRRFRAPAGARPQKCRSRKCTSTRSWAWARRRHDGHVALALVDSTRPPPRRAPLRPRGPPSRAVPASSRPARYRLTVRDLLVHAVNSRYDGEAPDLYGGCSSSQSAVESPLIPEEPYWLRSRCPRRCRCAGWHPWRLSSGYKKETVIARRGCYCPSRSFRCHQETAGRQMKLLPNVPATPMQPDQQSTLPCEGEQEMAQVLGNWRRWPNYARSTNLPATPRETFR